MVRLNDGTGPEVTVPEWADENPTPEQWLDWLLEQSRDAQLAISEFHLAMDDAITSIKKAIAEGAL